tara:strand:+ start:738 stop:941 length:204 start_codon:yes stop_codon:yes gene_type:complete
MLLKQLKDYLVKKKEDQLVPKKRLLKKVALKKVALKKVALKEVALKEVALKEVGVVLEVQVARNLRR